MVDIPLRIFRMGTSDWLLQWECESSQELLYYLLAVKKRLKEVFGGEVVHTYTEILIKGMPHQFDEVAVEIRLREIINSVAVTTTGTPTLFRIPVCYDLEFGKDIEDLASAKKMTPQDVIHLHTDPIYTIYFMGFLPGFPYLEGLNPQLHIERKSTPQLSVAKGSVAIGGSQTGIYPQESPGGWYVIGNSPISFFDVSKETPTPFKAGDVISLYTIDKTTHTDMKKAYEKGGLVLESRPYER